MIAAHAPDGSPGIFVASVLFNKIVQLGQGYTFHIYECPECTYVELHDNAPT